LASSAQAESIPRSETRKNWTPFTPARLAVLERERRRPLFGVEGRTTTSASEASLLLPFGWRM
jgi:hypothetical protein